VFISVAQSRKLGDNFVAHCYIIWGTSDITIAVQQLPTCPNIRTPS